jgi:hypothetical protein
MVTPSALTKGASVATSALTGEVAETMADSDGVDMVGGATSGLGVCTTTVGVGGAEVAVGVGWVSPPHAVIKASAIHSAHKRAVFTDTSPIHSVRAQDQARLHNRQDLRSQVGVGRSPGRIIQRRWYNFQPAYRQAAECRNGRKFLRPAAT